MPRFVREMIGLALALPTWRLMTQEQGLSDAACVDLFVDAIGCLSRKSEA
ncbi:MAG: hypothetical protein IT335_01285 [Thermomicrobiales bacterium]|nr:hypothetical protein [Thermomicrobiales bacterium]